MDISLEEMASTIAIKIFVVITEFLVHYDVIMPREAKVIRFVILIVNILSRMNFLKLITNNKMSLNPVVYDG